MPSTNTLNRQNPNDRKLIVLDIDETLLHASITKLDLPLDYKAARTFIYKRPYVNRFLSYCLQNFHVAVWTNASAGFAEEVFDQVLPISRHLEFLWSVEHCTDPPESEGCHDYKIKDLSKVCDLNFGLNNIVMLDDTAEKLRFNKRNLIHIRPFFGDQTDCELLHLIKYLEKIRLVDDIGNQNKQNWRQEVVGTNTAFEYDCLVVG